MELIDSILALGGTTLFVIAIVMALIGWKKISLGFQGNTLKIFKVGAVLFAIGGAVASGWLAMPEEETIADEEAVAWDVQATESMSHVISVGTNHYKVQINFNDTSDAFNSATQFCLLNFTIDRADTNTDFAFTSGEVVEIGDYTSTTTGFTYDIIAKGTDGLYEADWGKSNGGTVNLETTAPIDRDTRSDWATLNLTASATCVAQMTQYHSVLTKVAIGGETFTIEWEKTTITT